MIGQRKGKVEQKVREKKEKMEEGEDTEEEEEEEEKQSRRTWLGETTSSKGSHRCGRCPLPHPHPPLHRLTSLVKKTSLEPKKQRFSW